jgi:hypothetical protein
MATERGVTLMPGRRRLIPIIVVGAVVGTFALVFSLHGGLLATAGQGSSSHVAVVCPGAPQRAPGDPGAPGGIIGVPAITPRNDCTPSFTEQDVRAYLQTHQELIPAPHAPPTTVTLVQFMTSAEASQRMDGESIGLADDAIVCFVELSGEFMPYSVPPGVTPHLSSVGILVLDAHSGNILVESP